jgi:transposase
MDRLLELVRLHRMGTGARDVARLLSMSPNTERNWRTVLSAAGLLAGPVDELPDLALLRQALPQRVPRQQTSSIEEQSEAIRKLQAKGAQPRAIFDRLRLESLEFKGSYWSVKRLCRQLVKAAGPVARDVVIPVETAPGGVAQVDFGYVGELLDPVKQILRRAWVFVMVLAYSRHMYAEVVFDQRAETWQRVHVAAFEAFGGVPAVLVPDNLKAAVVRAAFGIDEEPGLQRSYRELARYYHFKVDPTPPRAPEKKGKVEAGVKYVRRNFVATLPEGLTIDEANRQLARWIREVAGQRIHGTTQQLPLERFAAEELTALQSLPAGRWRPVAWQQATVHRDSHVLFDRRLYSVPWRHIGALVWVRATADAVDIFLEEQRVALHERQGPGERSTVAEHLPSGRADLRFRGPECWEQRARAIGPETATLVEAIFHDDEVLLPLRKVQALVTHLESFPRSRAENTSRRANHFGVHDYRGIKDILQRALDFEPLQTTLPLGPARLALTIPPVPPPRFVRPVAEMLAGKQEKPDERN